MSDDNRAFLFAAGFAVAHAVFWTANLTLLKATQDIHFDTAEAFGWGQQFLQGYGKHPPLSGWVAGLWFKIFPQEDWAAYGLAMATVSFGMLVCWRIALQVVDKRRAFLVLVMLAIYPIFNFKGYKFNADLMQVATMPLVVLAYLNAFSQRTLRSGFWLGIAAAAAFLTKYWAVTLIGSIGLAALLHPARIAFLRSPAPWIAIVTFAVALGPHLMWLKQVDFLPFTYAGGTYAVSGRAEVLQLVLGYVGHNLALLLLPVALAAAALGWVPRWWQWLARDPAGFFALCWSRGPNPAVNPVQALNVWIIQIILAVGPPVGAYLLQIYLKTDWGISLFFLAPLALVAIPFLRVRWMAVIRLLLIWLVLSIVILLAAPKIADVSMKHTGTSAPAYGARAQLANDLTRMWRMRFASSLPAVVAGTDISAPITFYSTDHPIALTPLEPWQSGLMSFDQAQRTGFIGICERALPSFEACQKWMADNAADAERLVQTTRRFHDGKAMASSVWHVWIKPPAQR